MGRTYRRDDQHSWGKYNKDSTQKSNSERFTRNETTEFAPRNKKGKKNFDLSNTEYYDGDWNS